MGKGSFHDQSETDTETRPGYDPGVGTLLRNARLKSGLKLRDVSRTLRIRYRHLEAMENDRYEELPGPAYAVGFVRAYAEYLDLDGAEVVRRFKNSAAHLKSFNDLTFPVPVPEDGIPGGAILLISVIVAGLAYGGWYLSSAEDGFVIDLISSPPEHLLAEGDGGMGSLPAVESAVITPSESQPGNGETAILASAEQGETEPGETEPGETEQGETEQGETEQGETEQGETEQGETEQAETEQAESEGAETQPVEAAASTAPAMEQAPPVEAEIAAAPQPAAPESEPAAPENVPAAPESEPAAPEQETAVAQPQPAAPENVTAAPENAPAAPENVPVAPENVPVAPENVTAAPEDQPAAPANASAAPESTVAEAPRPVDQVAESDAVEIQELAVIPASPAPPPVETAVRVLGSQLGGSRIVVRARVNSWIQIRDDIADQLLVTRMLRAGDSYRVPNRSGLKLLTGNAGALDIRVDGISVPPIGPMGAVRRNVALDAESLKAGTAVSQ